MQSYRICKVLKYFSKSRKNYVLQKCYWWIRSSCRACTPTHPPYDYIMTSHLKKKSSKLVILLSICHKDLTGLGDFDSINSYLLASSYGLGYMSSFSKPMFTLIVLHCKTWTDINLHANIHALVTIQHAGSPTNRTVTQLWQCRLLNSPRLNYKYIIVHVVPCTGKSCLSN